MRSLNRMAAVSWPIASLTLALLMGVVSGCSGKKKPSATQAPPPAFTVKTGGNTNLVITPSATPVGRVASVNLQARFVVVGFPVGQLPANEARFSVFHAGMKVGEIKISIPPAPAENLVSADIVAGSAEKDDEVRAE